MLRALREILCRWRCGANRRRADRAWRRYEVDRDEWQRLQAYANQYGEDALPVSATFRKRYG